MAALRRALTVPRTGAGRLLVIKGSAGAGNSALLEAAVRTASETGLSVLRARGGQFEREHSFGLVRQLLEPEVRRRDPAARAAR